MTVAPTDFETVYAAVPAEQKELLRRFRADHPYKEIDFNGTTWRYIACGQGERALLFLPGGFLKADMYFYPILALKDSFRIIVPDSYTHQGTFTMDDVCRAIVQILDTEQIHKATVVGLSAGGGIAQVLVQEYPERVENLVLSHCGTIEPNPESEKQLRLLSRLAPLLPTSIMRRFILRKTTGPHPSSSQWVAFHDAYFQEGASEIRKGMIVHFLRTALEMRRSLRFDPERLRSWSGRVLVLSSKDDLLSIESVEKHQQHYVNVQTHIFEQGGHHTFMFFPERYTDVLKGFLAKTWKVCQFA
jgi:pimeloyl-ACP methyl ester carboxylesterase